MKAQYMVIGGYGQVGGFVSRNLVSENQSVIIAGRNLEKAEAFSKQYHLHCACRTVDTMHIQNGSFEEVSTVIMCVEENNVEVLKCCIKQGINYIDITPSYSIIGEIIAQKENIEKAGIKVIIGVGIAPGVSNMLCKEAVKELDEVTAINSYLMLGIGESHGKNAIRWLVNNLNVSYNESDDGKTMVKSFSDGRNVQLLKEEKKRRFVRIDLADWHLMLRKHPTAKVNAWYAYDKNIITRYFEILQKIGFLKLLKYKSFNKFFEYMMTSSMKVLKCIKYGTEQYASMVEVKGIKNHKTVTRQLMVTGKCNSELTAKVCMQAALKIENISSGLYALDDVLEVNQLNVEVLA